jgi:hypothetical protein
MEADFHAAKQKQDAVMRRIEMWNFPTSFLPNFGKKK